jgi:hypothetical protein
VAARALAAYMGRAEVLQALALQLANQASMTFAHQSYVWHITIRDLAARGRPAFLRDPAVLMPWLAALASPEELKEIAIAVRDVSRCWS